MIRSFLSKFSRQPAWGLFAPHKLKTKHRARNEIWVRRLCRSVYVGDRTVLARVLGRYKMYLDADDTGLSGHLMIDGYWEMWLSEALSQTLRRGMIVADIGANLGYFTVLMADRVGKQGIVHAFEPNATLASRLTRTLALNGFDQTTRLHQQALGAQDVAVRLIVPPNEPKNGHIVPTLPGQEDGDCIYLRRLDTYPELANLDVVKIDVEGAERQVWEGMAGILAHGRAMTVFMEFAVIRYEDASGFLDEILRWGFTLSRVDLAQGIVPCDRKDILSYPPHEDQMLCMRRETTLPNGDPAPTVPQSS